MYSNKVLAVENCFDYEETKKKVISYFLDLEKLKWEWAKFNLQKGLTVNYDFAVEYKKQPYMPSTEDVFALCAKESKEEQLKIHLSSYYWAKSILSEQEQLYIEECFINGKYEDEIIDVLGFSSSDSNGFRKLKRSAVYKFADVLDLVVTKGGVES